MFLVVDVVVVVVAVVVLVVVVVIDIVVVIVVDVIAVDVGADTAECRATSVHIHRLKFLILGPPAKWLMVNRIA